MHMLIYEESTQGRISEGSATCADHPSVACRRGVDQRSWLQDQKPNHRQAMISDSARAYYFAEWGAEPQPRRVTAAEANEQRSFHRDRRQIGRASCRERGSIS